MLFRSAHSKPALALVAAADSWPKRRRSVAWVRVVRPLSLRKLLEVLERRLGLKLEGLGKVVVGCESLELRRRRVGWSQELGRGEVRRRRVLRAQGRSVLRAGRSRQTRAGLTITAAQHSATGRSETLSSGEVTRTRALEASSRTSSRLGYRGRPPGAGCDEAAQVGRGRRGELVCGA